jgi:hypothetical protein
MSAATRPLGRLTPAHYDHVEKYPLELAVETPKVQPVAPGFNWYTAFDNPTKGRDGKYYLPSKRLGTIRGGHCVCLAPDQGRDTEAWHKFYDQGQEGACEGFGHARRFTLLFGETFDAFHLYDDARRIEATFPEGEGTTNDSICQALRKWGIHTQGGSVAHRAAGAGSAHPLAVKSYRWAKTAGEILTVLGLTSGTAIPLLNSWGDDYPEVVYLPPETLERLMREGGECDVLTDR